jgi:hypothetical protein
MRAAARLGLALTLVVSWGCTSTKPFAAGAHDNARVVYIDEGCNVFPLEAIIDYDRSAEPGSRKRLEVVWIIDKDDDLSAEIVAKPAIPSIGKLFDHTYKFPARVKEKKSGKVKAPPDFEPGRDVRWEYEVTIGTDVKDKRYCHKDPKICIRNPDGSSNCR